MIHHPVDTNQQPKQECKEELHDGQVALTMRVASVEESLRASHVNEFMRRIVFIEERIAWGLAVVS